MTEQTQPEALRVADKLNSLCVAEFAWETLNHAAILLRRHHALNRELANQLSGAKDRIAELEAQLAQRERPALTEHFPLASSSCWCESCDKAANGGFRSRMSLCPSCGDKRCQRSIHHINACDKERAHGIGDPT